MKQDYTKYSESSNNAEETNVQNDKLIKSLEECTVEELVEVAINEDVVFENIEMTKEELIAAIEANREQTTNPEAEGTEPEKDQPTTYDICPAKINGCAKLNLRREPSKDSDVVCVITKKNTITVCRELSTEDFYKVHTTIGETLVEGYCMKQFIEIE